VTASGAAVRPKSVLVLARRDHAEAMRVAAGLTIFGHDVRLVFMDRPLSQADAGSEQAELLELAEIEPETTVQGAGGGLKLLDAPALGAAIAASDAVLSL
jgi:hypothetical protein